MARFKSIKRERMRAGLRLGIALAAGAFALFPAPALAQEAPATTNTPATDAIGPRELQNFTLNGTVTQRSEQPAQLPATSRSPRGQNPSTSASTEPRATTAPPTKTAAATTSEPRPSQQATSERRPEPAAQSASASPIATTLPSPDTSSGTAAAALTAASSPAPAFAPELAGLAASERNFPIMPWLLAALVLGAGGAFLFWRNRSRHALAGGPPIDAFVAPEPAPAPRPAPAPPKAKTPAAPPAPAPPKAKTPAPSPSGAGIVSTRLRPWIEIGFNPTRCVLDEEKVAIEFEIELFNSGSAPARAVLVEASLFNAGPTQDSDIGAFFADPVGAGDRIAAIPPLKRFTVKTQVAIGREQLQAYEAAGRQLIVPLIAFNALYRWSGGEGQTSVGYLLGRGTESEKMAPFRIDLGPRIFRGLSARLLPTGVRR
jgi:hypothetical protein